MQRCEFAYRSRTGKSQEAILCSTAFVLQAAKGTFHMAITLYYEQFETLLGDLLAIFTDSGNATIASNTQSVIQENEKQYHVEINLQILIVFHYCFLFFYIFRLSVVIGLVSIIAENFARNSFTGCV